jgi:hypothetical protein
MENRDEATQTNKPELDSPGNSTGRSVGRIDQTPGMKEGSGKHILRSMNHDANFQQQKRTTYDGPIPGPSLDIQLPD